MSPNDNWAQTISGGWVNTISGKKILLHNPDPDQITPYDIAHGLAMQCRYNGHVNRFYSVAEHSIMVARRLADVYGPRMALAGLLHDASEAYLGDIASPVKQYLPDYYVMENSVMEVILEKFGLPPDAYKSDEVVEADRRLLATEVDQLIPQLHEDWNIDIDIEPYRMVLPCWDPVRAKEEFRYELKRYAPRMKDLFRV